MNRHVRLTTALIGAATLLLPLSLPAFNSGSTGADGAFNPFLTNTELQLPPDGIFNFTSVNIPVGVTVTFKRNTANTPAVLLVQGDVVIDGTINVSGKGSYPYGGDPAYDGFPGEGGPGGFDGGLATPYNVGARGGSGLGLGGGAGGFDHSASAGCGSYASVGSGGFPGTTYGSPLLQPLIGGSGGGGARSFCCVGLWSYWGLGGGGGGGAILIAASGSVSINGSLLALGGSGGSRSTNGHIESTGGGGGSGGAIRLVASRVYGKGSIKAVGGSYWTSGSGGVGRIRIEADAIATGVTTDPPFTPGLPGEIFSPNLPALSITNIAALSVPANPTGRGDVTLPATTPDPVNVALHTNGVPPGTIIKLTMTPEYGAATSTNSPPTAGTLADASTTVSVSIPEGRSVLMATTSFIVTAALGEQLTPYAQGETVEQVRLTASPGQPSRMVLLTASGRELDLPAGALAQGW